MISSKLEGQEKIIKVIEIFYPQAKIYLFGSYARGDFRRGSDIDIAIDNEAKISLIEKSQIKTMIEALNLIQDVDVVDFQTLPDDMQKTILTEGVVWKDFRKPFSLCKCPEKSTRHENLL